MWEERAPARLIFHTDKCLLSYREQEAELLYLSYLLWWHTEPWARRGGPWWLLPLCGDRGLWSGKEKKGFYSKDEVWIQTETSPNTAAASHIDGLLLWTPAVYLLSHTQVGSTKLLWSQGREMCLQAGWFPTLRSAPHFSIKLSFLLNQPKGTSQSLSRMVWQTITFTPTQKPVNIFQGSAFLIQSNPIQSHSGNSHLHCN